VVRNETEKHMRPFKPIYWAALLSGVLSATVPMFAAGPLVPAEHGMASAALMEPVKSVMDDYLKVGAALAKDTFEGVPEPAKAMSKAIQGDSMKMLPPEVAKLAQALAEATDLASARKAFKPLSESLIKYLKDQKVPPGTYHEVYCPMAKASWLQADKTVANPYFGKAMLRCGEIKS
jgi:hypothetical protein